MIRVACSLDSCSRCLMRTPRAAAYNKVRGHHGPGSLFPLPCTSTATPSFSRRAKAALPPSTSKWKSECDRYDRAMLEEATHQPLPWLRAATRSAAFSSFRVITTQRQSLPKRGRCSSASLPKAMNWQSNGSSLPCGDTRPSNMRSKRAAKASAFTGIGVRVSLAVELSNTGRKTRYWKAGCFW